MKTSVVFMLVLLLAASIFAVPQQINYQGSLASPSGAALDTTVAMSFTLYTDSLSGSSLWTETRSAVAVQSGLFNANLGQVTPLTDAVLNNSQVWLGITVGDDAEMTPRARLVSVPYSYRVGTVDGASGGTIVSDLSVQSKINVGSGNSNPASFANVLGSTNTAGSLFSTVSGGSQNSAFNSWAVVCGGIGNTASGLAATVAGGQSNSAESSLSFVAGGSQNHATGSYSFAGGQQAQANHTGAFVWGSTITGTDATASFGNNTFTARCSGGARFYTALSGTATGVSLPAGGGSWASLSDRNKKENFRKVDTKEILDKVAQLDVTEWNYKSQDSKIRHMGPMAQDFYRLFGLGESDTTITQVDPDGVMLAAIQGQQKEIQDLKSANSKLEGELHDLRTAVQSLQAGNKESNKMR